MTENFIVVVVFCWQIYELAVLGSSLFLSAVFAAIAGANFNFSYVLLLAPFSKILPGAIIKKMGYCVSDDYSTFIYWPG